MGSEMMREYSRRRRALMDRIGSHGIAILPSAAVANRTGDSNYPFRQRNDLYYLTGFIEPEAVAVLAPGRSQGEFVLFCLESDPAREQWEGRRIGIHRAREIYGAEQAFPIHALDQMLPEIMSGRAAVFAPFGQSQAFEGRLWQSVNALRVQTKHGVEPPTDFVDIGKHLNEMRLIKSELEIELMSQAAERTYAAHLRAWTSAGEGMRESELAAEIIHEFLRQGGVPAYSPIVAAGENACILHYRDNEDLIPAGSLVLIDAGCEYEYYACDVTRTFPISGKFTTPQREIYEIVLRAQAAAIEACVVGARWNEPHEKAVEAITTGLRDLGLLRGSVEELIACGAYREFFMHKTGHWLGLDVHDVGNYKMDGLWREFQAGMIFTVEPGIYISPRNNSIPEEYRGIGVRIEDDILIAEAGPINLTRKIPSRVDEIEAVIRAAAASRKDALVA